MIVALAIYFVLLAVTIPVQHIAFGRHAKWRRNELARRAIGWLTIMGAAVIPVLYAGGDWFTWLIILAGAAFAGLIIGVMTISEQLRILQVRTRVNEQFEAQATEEQ